MNVPGTTVSEQDTASGAALAFSTPSGPVDELRSRVRAMADTYNQRRGQQRGGMHGRQGGMQGRTTMGEGMGMSGAGGMTMMPRSRASAEDTSDGARLSLVPQDPGQVDELRTAVRMHAQRMQQGGCAEGSMMSE